MGQSVGGAKMGEPLKTPGTPTSRTWPLSHAQCGGSNPLQTQR